MGVEIKIIKNYKIKTIHSSNGHRGWRRGWCGDGLCAVFVGIPVAVPAVHPEPLRDARSHPRAFRQGGGGRQRHAPIAGGGTSTGSSTRNSTRSSSGSSRNGGRGSSTSARGIDSDDDHGRG